MSLRVNVCFCPSCCRFLPSFEDNHRKITSKAAAIINLSQSLPAAAQLNPTLLTLPLNREFEKRRAVFEESGKILEECVFLLDKITSIVEKDDYQTAVTKVQTLTSQAELIYLSVLNIKNYTIPTGPINDILINPNLETNWAKNYRFKFELSQAFEKHWTQVVETSQYHIDRKLSPLLREITIIHPTLFDVHDTPYVRNEWIYFPDLLDFQNNPEYKYLLEVSEREKSSHAAAVNCLENGSAIYTLPLGPRITVRDGNLDTYEMPLEEFIDQILGTNYKIHLMFKPEYVWAGLEKFLEILGSDQELRKAIMTFKVLLATKIREDNNNRIMPFIVIYPLRGKNHAQKVLTKLMLLLQPYFHWGCGICPRYNVDIKNPLIFYAQGEGFEKSCLEKEKPQIFRQLYDPDGTHYNARFGSYRLQLSP